MENKKYKVTLTYSTEAGTTMLNLKNVKYIDVTERFITFTFANGEGSFTQNIDKLVNYTIK